MFCWFDFSPQITQIFTDYTFNSIRMVYKKSVFICVICGELKGSIAARKNENSRNRFISDYGSKGKADFWVKSYT